MRVIVSVTSTSVLVVMFALLYEVSSGARRLAYLLTSTALAYTSLPVAFFAANSLRPNWIEVYRCLAILACVLLVFYYTIDESPRWLLVKWKVHEAERVALRAARLNGIHPRDCLGKLDTGGAELPKVEAGLIAKIFAICEPNLRRRTALLSFIWLVFICAYNVVNLTLIISPNAVVSALNIILAGPAQLLLYPSMRLFGVKRTAVVVSVLFTLLTLVLALQYREQRAVYTTVLLVVMRVLLEMLTLLISIITVATFPTSTRCWGACVLFAVGRVGSFIGLMYSIYEGDHRKDIVLCVMAAFMIFVCGAVECMPDDADDRSWQGSTARSSISWRNLESTPEKDGRLHGACLSTGRTDSSIRSTKEHAMIPLRGRGKRASAQNDTSSGFSRSQVLSLLEGPRVSSATKLRMHARGSDASVGRRPSAVHHNSQGFGPTPQEEQ
ncbi:hypothetical protein HPB50_005653 [Hyalomma asiaticum]|uniref:Uncharacterized protein n=1 Tax=Hyalomma asiaticum TaxID=266040 RepID=A0ACB7RQQ2_HYAAI|nr:hypothetical protein HPB50_005653 [Hyalomma asiaticum]